MQALPLAKPDCGGSASMAQIRSKYGSEIFRAAQREELPA